MTKSSGARKNGFATKCLITSRKMMSENDSRSIEKTRWPGSRISKRRLLKSAFLLNLHPSLLSFSRLFNS